MKRINQYSYSTAFQEQLLNALFQLEKDEIIIDYENLEMVYTVQK